MRKKALGNRHQALGKDGGAVADGDLRARVARIDKSIHALANGATGLTAQVFPEGKPALRIVTASQLYVVQINAGWGAKQRGNGLRSVKWMRLVEARDALMIAGLESMAELIAEWKRVLARHEGTGLGKAEQRMDEIEELLRV